MNEWNIQSRAHACQACGRHFSEKQQYHTVLMDQRHEVHRMDLCEACWRDSHADGASSRQGFISHWQGVYEQPPQAPPEAIKKENAEDLLRKIIERNDPRFAAASYILAVMLERKRILKVKEQFKRDGRRIFVYEQPKTADLFTIPDPGLQLNQLDDVQRDVAALLEHGLPEEASASAAAAAAAVAEGGAVESPTAGAADGGGGGGAGEGHSGTEGAPAEDGEAVPTRD